MARLVKERPLICKFDQASRIHHSHAIRCLGNDTHIVRHQNNCRTVFFTKLFKKFNDLSLYRYIERRCGLISNDEFRICTERQCNNHTLTHTSGELMRIVVHSLVCGRHPGRYQKTNGPFTCLFLTQIGMNADRFD